MLRSLGFLLSLMFILAACGGGTEAPANNPPTLAITAQPSDVSVVAPNTATFNVSATGTGLGYQWQSNSGVGSAFNNIAGATSSSFTTPATSTADSGKQFRVVVSGNGSSITSSAATLTVTAAIIAPAITMQPTAQTITAGQNASFSVTATGSSIAYQWQNSLDGGVTFANVAGGNSATLLLNAVAIGRNAQQYRVVVSNGAGTVTSNAVLLTVNPAPVAPTISTQPANATVAAPGAATFNVVANGTPSPSYQWQLSANAGASFADIAGANASGYTTPATTTADSGKQYRVAISNSAGSVTSNAATLTVNAAAILPSFTTQPQSVAVSAGQNAQLTVAASGSPTPTLQWQLSTDNGVSWSNINGATSPVFDIIGPSIANNGRQFRAVASNSVGSVNSNAATLTVNAPQQRVIYRQRVGANDNIVTVNVDGSGPVTRLLIGNNDVFAGTTPDGKIIIQSTVNNQQDLYSVERDGSNSIALANSGDNETLVGTTASNQVIYLRTSSDFTTVGLYSVNSDGSGRMGPLSLTTTAENVSILKLLDDGRVVFRKYTPGSQSAIYITNTQRTSTSILWNSAPNAIHDGLCAVAPSGKILFRTAKYPNSPVYDEDLYLIDPSSNAPVAIGQTAADEDCGNFTATEQVVFLRFVPYPDSDLFAANANGSGEVTLSATGDRDFYAGSTPSGKIIFYRQNAAGTNSLYSVNADGSNAQLLVAAGGFVTATTTDRVVYAANLNGQETLFSINADGSGVATLDAPFASGYITGVATGGRIVYQRSVNNGLSIDLYSVNPDGTGRVRLDGAAFFLGFAK